MLTTITKCTGKVPDSLAKGRPAGAAAAAAGNPDSKKEIQGVFVVQNGRARFRPVKTGITGVTDIEITDGLQEGDEIVTGSYKVLRELKHLTRVRKAKGEQNRPPS